MLCLEHIDIKDLFEKRRALLGRFLENALRNGLVSQPGHPRSEAARSLRPVDGR